MNSQPYSLAINELGDNDSGTRESILPVSCLHYCPPSVGSWGIIRVGLMVPESVMLFVSPNGCGRHGAIAGKQLGFKKRLFFLHVNEIDLVTGAHVENVYRAVDEIMEQIKPRPKAMLICATCMDDLLGSDYESIAYILERKHGIPIRACHMDPIAMDGKTPPQLTIQRAVYDFLSLAQNKDNAINIIGNFAPVDSGSDLYEIMSAAGIDKVNHVMACAKLEEFYLMSQARLNVLIKPLGRLAAEHMQYKLGIPYCYAPVSYGLESITYNYSILERHLDSKLPIADYLAEAEDTIAYYQAELGHLTVAVGSTANGRPFELSRALIEYGFRVPYIFADDIISIDEEHIEWLKKHAPATRVYTNVHPTMADFLKKGLKVDLAVGMDAGYFCSGARTAVLSLDTQAYGYRAIRTLFSEMLTALNSSQSHREQMYASGMVI
ncbi:MAG: nitrogenase component 1 [Bacillota bacterium]|nr:nitrogenase component 1 [Bacillota bacterium]